MAGSGQGHGTNRVNDTPRWLSATLRRPAAAGPGPVLCVDKTSTIIMCFCFCPGVLFCVPSPLSRAFDVVVALVAPQLHSKTRRRNAGATGSALSRKQLHELQ